MKNVEQIICKVKKYWNNATWLELIAIVPVAFVLMFVLLYKLGTLSSGYHFLDDHELIRLEVSLKENHISLSRVMNDWLLNDMGWRFRPFYWVERVTLADIFGSNMLYWNCYTAIKGVITFWLLYFSARYLKCNPIISGLFTGLILYGAQFTPWYRSANQESTGLMLGALVVFLIVIQAYYRKYKSIWLNILILVSAILCGLTKESFTLLMPAFGALKLWLEYRQEPKRKLGDCLKSVWWLYGIMALAFLVNVYMIVFYIGMDNVSYAGFHEDTGWKKYLQGVVGSYRVPLYHYINMAVFFLLCILIGAGWKNWKKYSGYFFIGGYVVMSQLAVHAGNWMVDRYLIPWIVGYAALFVILGYKMLQHTKVLKWIYLLALCVLFYLEAPLALTKGRAYAYDGWLTAVQFQTILDATDENSRIISAFSDAELNLSTESWMESHGRTQVYSYDTHTGELFNYVQIKGEPPTNLDWQSADVVACYENQAVGLAEQMGFTDPSQYSVSVTSPYAVIIRE